MEVGHHRTWHFHAPIYNLSEVDFTERGHQPFPSGAFSASHLLNYHGGTQRRSTIPGIPTKGYLILFKTSILRLRIVSHTDDSVPPHTQPPLLTLRSRVRPPPRHVRVVFGRLGFVENLRQRQGRDGVVEGAVKVKLNEGEQRRTASTQTRRERHSLERAGLRRPNQPRIRHLL
ncbi:hypothetical protein OE88DRAFT_899353 [Heliocybe sulcata]|uniref:Uncharacterized protein n=1 Tax=Heliocybe sulcata TaxID=5364 RepID=A0A5C3MQA5_9AGAM|nr:hypothetical protein OE88DRAFT_899353 [Heliocybe sulcata]